MQKILSKDTLDDRTHIEELEYIDDSSLVTDNVMFTTVYNYPDGFNDTPELILITAG